MSESVAAAAPANVIQSTTAEGDTTDATHEAQVGETSGTQAPKKGATTPSEPKKYKLKIRNEEREVDEDMVVKYAQQAFGAERTFEEAKKLREEAGEIKKLQDLLQSDDADVEDQLAAYEKLLGPKAARLAEERVWRELQRQKEEEQLSPREKQYRQALERQHRELSQLQQEKAEQERSRGESRQRAIYEGVKEQLSTVALEAAKHLGMQNTPAPVVFRKLVPYIEQALQAGGQIDPQVIAGLATADSRAEMKDLTHSLDGEALISWLGDEVANKIRKADLARLRGPQSATRTPAPQKGEPTVSDPKLGRWAFINKL